MNTDHRKFHITLFMLMGMLISLARTSYAQTNELYYGDKKTLPGNIDTSQLSAASPVTVRFFRGYGSNLVTNETCDRVLTNFILTDYFPV